MYECILLLHEGNVYQSDIKPANIAFFSNAEFDEYELKLIDFGVAGASYDEVVSYTRFYFFNERNRKYENRKKMVFSSKEDRVKVDLYSVSIIAL